MRIFKGLAMPKHVELRPNNVNRFAVEFETHSEAMQVLVLDRTYIGRNMEHVEKHTCMCVSPVYHMYYIVCFSKYFVLCISYAFGTN